MDSTVFATLFGTITLLGGGVITYLLAKVKSLESEVRRLRNENQKLETVVNDFLSSFLIINQQSSTPIDDKVLSLVIQTRNQLRQIQKKTDQEILE
jgi:hypothetical protein